MSEHRSSAARMKLHEAMNSLSVTLAHLELGQRRLRGGAQMQSDEQFDSNLHTARNRLLLAIAQVREAERILDAEPEPPGALPHLDDDADARPDAEEKAGAIRLEREDEDLFFDSEEGADF